MSEPSMRLNVPIPIDASEQALEELFRHTPVGVILTDLHGTIIDANDSLCATLGFDREALVGETFTRFVHPEERRSTEEGLAQLREGGIANTQCTRRCLASDGRIITARVTVSLVRSKDGEPICGIAFVEDIGERLALDEALRASEQRYRRVVQDQTELIVRCLPDGTRLFVNDAYCRYNDATAEELIGTSFLSCILEDERELILRKFAALTPQSPVITDSHQVIDPRGAIRWHEWTERGFFDDAGNLVEIQSVGRDITETREAQEQTRRSEEVFGTLYASLPVAVWETDFSGVLPALTSRGLDTPARLIEAVEDDASVFFSLTPSARIRRANRAAFALTGASDTSGIFEWLRTRYTPEAARAYVRSAAELILGDHAVADIELPLRAPDGRRIDLLQRLARLPGWPEEPRLISITLDVTQRKATERDLAHRRRVLEEAEPLAHIGSWDWDPATNQVYGSAGFWRIMDRTSEARFASVDETVRCFHADDRAHVLERWETLRHTGRDIEGGDRDTRIVHPDGEVLIGRSVAFTERSSTGGIARMYGVLQDVTEQRRAEQAAVREREALTRADKMISLGILLAGVAHEINNPNHAILLNARVLREAWKSVVPVLDRHAAENGELLVAGLPWQEMRTEIATTIEDVDHAAGRVGAIVAELRNFARSHDSGEHQSLSINDVVQSSLRLIGNHIRKATQAFSVALTHDLPRVRGNGRRLEQVVINLVLNSCQALESPDAMISIETGATPTHVFVRVTDAGRGIRKEDLGMIKDPFFTTKRAEGGTGLGLAVSERIVQEHGAELTFESSPGRGTVATLSLPREKP
jgi:PAS domain S-box-containing protein